MIDLEILKLFNEMLNEGFNLQNIIDSVIKIKAIKEFDNLYEDSLKLSALE